MHMEGRVYFITDGEAIKIGFSGAPEVRRRDLQVANHRQLQILGSIPGTERDEWLLHQRFVHLRIRGDWFRPQPDLMAFIEDEVYAPARLRAEIRKVRQELLEWTGDKTGHPKTCGESLHYILGMLLEAPHSADLRRTANFCIASLETSLADQARRRNAA